MIGERKEELSVKPYLYGYFAKSKFSLLIGFIILSYVIQFLLVLEGFQFLDLLSAVLPVCIGIGLLKFYFNNKNCDFQEGSLKFIVVALTIAWVILLIGLGIMALGSLALLFSGQMLLLMVILITGGLLFISASAYQFTIRSIKELSACYTKNHISTPSFEKAQKIWFILGWIGVVAQGLLLLLQDKVEPVEQAKLTQWINFGGFSQALSIISMVLSLAMPFVLAYAFQVGKVELDEISLEYEQEVEEAEKNKLDVVEY